MSSCALDGQLLSCIAVELGSRFEVLVLQLTLLTGAHANLHLELLRIAGVCLGSIVSDRRSMSFSNRHAFFN